MNLKISIVIVLLLSGCAQKNTENVILKKEHIFDRDSVQLFLELQNDNQPSANTIFLSAIDQYRNKKDAKGAIDLFVQSICISPDAKSYYELGNALLDNKEYTSALKAYDMAEQFGFEPLSKLLYNMACAHSLSRNYSGAIEYLEYAIEAGYSNKEQIFTDPDLSYIRERDYYKYAVVKALSGTSNEGDLLWQSFKREFRNAEFPVVINYETQNLLADAAYISYDFEKFVSEMRDGKFSREVGKEFYYYVLLESNDNYNALVYAVRNVMAGENAPYGYMLITCTNTGKLIDKMHIGGRLTMADLFKACTINENLFFEIKEYRYTYKDDPEEKGYENNPVINTELVTTEKYSINNSGDISKETPALTMK